MTKINARLTLDCTSTHQKFGSDATKKDVVLKTWSRTLKNKNTFPDDWINMPRVLLGVEYYEWRGRESTQLLQQPMEPP